MLLLSREERHHDTQLEVTRRIKLILTEARTLIRETEKFFIPGKRVTLDHKGMIIHRTKKRGIKVPEKGKSGGDSGLESWATALPIASWSVIPLEPTPRSACGATPPWAEPGRRQGITALRTTFPSPALLRVHHHLQLQHVQILAEPNASIIRYLRFNLAVSRQPTS